MLEDDDFRIRRRHGLQVAPVATDHEVDGIAAVEKTASRAEHRPGNAAATKAAE